MSVADLLTSTTCAESMDFGIPSIAIMSEGRGRLQVVDSQNHEASE